MNRYSVSYYTRRLLHEASRALRPPMKTGVASLRVVVPTEDVAGLKLATGWSFNWKSHLLGRLLAASDGNLLDVGANVGQTLIDFLISCTRGKYLGVEPNANCVRLLEEIIRLNLAQQAAILPIGLSNRNAILKLFIDDAASTSSGASLVETLRPDRVFETRFVPCFRYDDLARDIDVPRFNIIKIDVEGGELQVLQGMEKIIRAHGPRILCEVLHRDLKVHESSHQKSLTALQDFLTSIDYSILQVVKNIDASRFASFKPIGSFSNSVWSEENREECDYLFVPNSDVENVMSLIP